MSDLIERLRETDADSQAEWGPNPISDLLQESVVEIERLRYRLERIYNLATPGNGQEPSRRLSEIFEILEISGVENHEPPESRFADYTGPAPMTMAERNARVSRRPEHYCVICKELHGHDEPCASERQEPKNHWPYESDEPMENSVCQSHGPDIEITDEFADPDSGREAIEKDASERQEISFKGKKITWDCDCVLDPDQGCQNQAGRRCVQYNRICQPKPCFACGGRSGAPCPDCGGTGIASDRQDHEG